MNWPNIDPTLPNLSLVLDSNAVRQRFEQQWPARDVADRSSVTVLSCRRQDVHYVPATRCVATYSLVVKQAELAPWPTIGVVEVTPSGLDHRLFLADPDLPGLVIAADGEAMRTRFSALSGQWGQAGAIEACTVTPIRYKPGARCTYRYDLRTVSGLESYFGKLVAHQSAQLWATIVTLDRASQWLSAAGTAQVWPRISPPLVYWPEMPMLVQAAVTGAELHAAAFDPEINVTTRLDWLAAAGRSSAALHMLAEGASPAAAICAELAAPQPTLTDDLAELAVYCPALRQVNDSLADRFAEVIGDLTTVTQQRKELAPVLSHGALRTDQFMLETGQVAIGDSKNGRLVLIDLDGVCWANPARDLGNFLAYLTWKAMRQPEHAAFIHRAQQAFLHGYAELRALPADEWLALYQAASLLKILGRRYTGLTVQEWPLTEQLLDQAAALVKI